jgi:hypothetical protein
LAGFLVGATAGVVEAAVEVVLIPAPGVATLITCGAAVALPAELELARPISTPMPIASSSTPTPAITETVLLARPFVDPAGGAFSP